MHGRRGLHNKSTRDYLVTYVALKITKAYTVRITDFYIRN